MKSKLMAGGILTLSTLAWAAKDPVVMRVNGVDVPKSEFEYLYKKNSQQQIEPQPLDKYIDMFAIYKMKVADAKANGLDTVATFKADLDKYLEDLAQPYLTDSVYLKYLVNSTLERMDTEAEAHHIMLYKDRSGNNAAIKARIDSIRQALQHGADFAELAAACSEDAGSKQNGGSMGYIVPLRFPYDFEVAVFSLPEGKYSDVIESGVGYHIIRGGKKIPSRGLLQTSHIMKMIRPDMSQEDKDKAKAEIDSIYNVLQQDPSKFEELATALSDDKQSGSRGGALPPFTSGEMVPEFNEKAFSLKDGEISEPTLSRYGWHIIRRNESRPLPDKETISRQLYQVYGDPSGNRYSVLEDHQYETYAKKFHPKRNETVCKSVISDINTIGLDSAFIAKYSNPAFSSLNILTVNKHDYTIADMLPALRKYHYPVSDYAVTCFENEFDKLEKKALKKEAMLQLEKDEPDYRNLVNEYRDGSLLYEISVRKVWDKASKDKEGLEKYFEEHRKDFAWTEPHVKGYLIQASNDSIANAIRLRLQQLEEGDYLKTIRQEFKNVATIDKVLTTQGQNPMIDNLVFGASEATPSNPAYTTYFLFDQKVIMEPENVQDAKVVVTNAYQNELESQWIDELRAKYPVEINEKELKKIK
ncbi:MAG: peptidylprolyl isomerase [Bacteroides sp.]|nr:peptidylprolyl isomerase [Bacteroides sp.]